jgi:hypothetical protein
MTDNNRKGLMMIYPIKFDKDNLDFIMEYMDNMGETQENSFDYYVNLFMRIGIEQTKKAFDDPDWFEMIRMKIKKEFNDS